MFANACKSKTENMWNNRPEWQYLARPCWIATDLHGKILLRTQMGTTWHHHTIIFSQMTTSISQVQMHLAILCRNKTRVVHQELGGHRWRSSSSSCCGLRDKIDKSQQVEDDSQERRRQHVRQEEDPNIWKISQVWQTVSGICCWLIPTLCIWIVIFSSTMQGCL